MNHRIARCFARQHAVISRAQALAAGLETSHIDYLLRSGRWRSIAPRVYALTGAPLDDRSHLMAATLASGGIASHRSAAYLHGLLDRPPRQPEITIDADRRYRGPAIVHRSRDLLDIDRTTRQRIPCTNATRVLLDLGRSVPPAVLEGALHHALRERLVDFDALVARFFQVARRGRDGIGPLRRLLCEYDDSMAPADSHLETRLLRILADAGLPPPVRQHPLVLDGVACFVDVCYPEIRLAIEGDGFGWHAVRSRFEHDRVRQNLLVLHGWSVLRFTWRQLCGHAEVVASSVARAHARATAA
jgi:very-short-patch-repair endonuclease